MGKRRVICLDTNFLIAALSAKSPQDVALRRWFADGQAVRINTIVWAEFLCGPVTAEQVRLSNAIVGEPVSLLAEDASRAAQLFNSSGRRRGSLADCLIAATCIRLDAPLATLNIDDFRRFEPMGLKMSAT